MHWFVERILRRSSSISPSTANLAWIPCTLTAFGAAFSLAWIAGAAGWWAGIVGLLLDVADGHIARRLGATTEFGSLFDWSVDVVLCALALERAAPMLGPLALCFLLPAQVLARERGVHFCGRAAVFLVLIAAEVLR